MKHHEILAAIALQNGVSVSEVRKELQQAIDEGMASPDPAARAHWRSIPRRGEKPTVEETLDFLSREARESR